MMKRISLLIIFFIAGVTFYSCNSGDSDFLTSDYSYDDFEELEDDPDQDPEEVELQAGINDVMLKVNGAERFFRCFIPEELDEEAPIHLFFYFHGNIDVTNKMIVPYSGFTENHIFSVNAKTRNTIVVYPAGEIYEIAGKVFGWNDHESNALFVEEMVKFFKKEFPSTDDTGAYISGQSSGAIFCFGLCLIKPEILGAAFPVSGQIGHKDGLVKPEKIVPIYAINGGMDDIVNYTGAYNNFDYYARNVGGCTNDEVLEEPLMAEDQYYIKYTWQDCEADFQLYKFSTFGHIIDYRYTTPIIWSKIDELNNK